MRNIFILLCIIFLVAVIGCSSAGRNPATPGGIPSDETPLFNPEEIAKINDYFNQADGQVVLGAFQLVADFDTMEMNMVPYDDRAAMAEFNVLGFLKPPYCPLEKCWYTEAAYYDSTNDIWDFNMYMYNPTWYTGYDVRAVFINLWDYDPAYPEKTDDIVIINPDGWTKINDDPTTEPDMNPYVLFNKEEIPTIAYPDPVRSFPPRTLDVERLRMKYPATAPAGPIFIVLASYPAQAEEYLQYLFIDQRPPMDPSIAGFSYLTCGIWEHGSQGEDEQAQVFFSCPDVLGLDGLGNPKEIELQRWFVNGERQFLSWQTRIANEMDVRIAGNYPCLLRAHTPNEGDFDAYYKFNLKVRKNTGGTGETDYDAPVAWTSFENGDGEVYVSDSIYLARTQNATNAPDFLDVDPCWVKMGSYYFLFFASDANYDNPGDTDFDLYFHIFQRSENKMVRISPNRPYSLFAGGLVGDERCPAVSPNKDFLVYQGQEFEGGDAEIFRVGINISGAPPNVNITSIPQNLTDNNADDKNPSIDMFGNFMLFDSDMNGSNQRNIFGMVPTVGSRISILTNSGYSDTEPVCQPSDPNLFLFTRSGEVEKSDIMVARMSSYVVVDVRDITRDIGDSNEKHASWSPSSECFVFSADKGSSGNYELFGIGLDSTGLDQLTTSGYDNLTPVWGPIR